MRHAIIVRIVRPKSKFLPHFRRLAENPTSAQRPPVGGKSGQLWITLADQARGLMQVDRGIERSLVGECNETVVEKRGAYRQLRALHGKTGIVVPRDLFESDE